ncbi:5-hydroxytryptamine receptor 3A-like isoform X1 [Scyliorhinus canicula]|uniref:5-hydroxytryptamine receptor 3A-like isoform X1 n=1 Tax=Scyliorhinus canicula TaxID=7830 RepID=UPI0018F72D70|nr:5-hydroxytryptamine receptor 3A-like isoform X1 [Scyliorhinus canicula]
MALGGYTVLGFRADWKSFCLSVTFICLFQVNLSNLSLSDSDGVRFTKTFAEVFENSAFRPVKNFSQTLDINITINLHAILGLDEKQEILTTYIWMEQSWFHDFLVWDPSDFSGKEFVALPKEKLWIPDTLMLEMVDEDKSPELLYLYVHHTGKVIYGRPLRIVSSCNLNILYFPFDIQKCPLSASPITLRDYDVKLHLEQTSEEVTSKSTKIFASKGEWELIQIEASEKKFLDDWASYDYVSWEVTIKRRPMFYIVNLLIPSAFLMATDIMSFYLPTHSFDRASFKMTLMLGYSVFLIIVKDLLPSNSTHTPLIAIFFLVSLTFMVTSLFETIIVINVIHQNGKQRKAVPPWLRTIVLVYGAKLFWRKGKQRVYHQMSRLPQNVSITDQDCEVKRSWPPEIETLQALLRKIAEGVEEIKQCVERHDQEQEMEDEWLQIGHILDCFLHSVYLVFFTAFLLTLSIAWLM